MVDSPGSSVYDIANVHIGNATTNDLWAALSKASGKDVNVFMVCLAVVTPFFRADLRVCRIRGSEKSDFRFSPLQKSPGKLASDSRVFFKQET